MPWNLFVLIIICFIIVGIVVLAGIALWTDNDTKSTRIPPPALFTGQFPPTGQKDGDIWYDKGAAAQLKVRTWHEAAQVWVPTTITREL